MRVCWIVLLAAVPFAHAQDAVRGPDGRASVHVPGVEVLTIPGKPFTAQTSTEWVRQEQGGSTVKLHLTAQIARDSSGRVYRERRGFVPDGSPAEPPLTEFILYDPVASTETTCTLARRSCIITSFHARGAFALVPAGFFANGTRYLTREPLGTKTLEGFDLAGTRETVTVNPGVLGNDRPLVSTREFWYSEDLQTNLAVTRNDPMEGLQAIQLSNISRAEPESSRFTVPSGFALRDARTAAQPAR